MGNNNMPIKTIKKAHRYSRQQQKAFRAFERAVEDFRNASDCIRQGLVLGEVTPDIITRVWEASLLITSEGLLPLVKRSEFTIIQQCVPARERLVHEMRIHNETHQD
jgi:hypothetical protein